MFFFNQIPLFRLAFPLTAGIITGIYAGDFAVSSEIILILLGLLSLVLYTLTIFTRELSYKKRWIHGTSLHSLVFIIGFIVSIIQTERFYPNHISQLDEKPHLFLVKARGNVVEKTKSFKLEVQVMSRMEDGRQKNTNGKVILYLAKDSISSGIKYGDVLLINAPLQKLREAQNPAQFDYKQFLLFRQVTRQAYIPPESLKLTGVNEGYSIFKWIYELRDSMLDILRKHGLEGREFAVGAALILGYTDELDPEIMRAYAGSGALHVLSVSGLHVGIMYAVLAFFLSFLDRFKRGNIIKAVILLLFLAFYAMITGLSPSVLRASVMFGFIVIAKSFNYHTNIYNTLAVSLISLLIYDPYLIMQVGFQLSYLAVIGIVAIQPWLVELWSPKTKLINSIWEITCVSVAAQIATSALGFLYFHQFPVYFMISNLIVIPVSTGILYLGLATLVSDIIPVPEICDFLTEVLKWMIWVLNKSVEITEALPYSIIDGIDISITETWLLYAVVMALFVFFTKRNIVGLYVALAALLLVSVTQLFEAIQQNTQQKFVVYNVADASVYDVIQGRQNSFYASSKLINDKDKMLFNIEHNWWKNGLDKQTIIHLDSVNKFSGIFYFPVAGKIILGVNNSFNSKVIYTKKMKTDFVVLGENTSIKVAEIIEYFNPELVIFDSSNSTKKCKRWEKDCLKLGLKFYNVADQGAFVAEL